MFKILIGIILAIHAINGELTVVESVVDSIVAHFVRISDPDNLVPEEVDKLKENCKKAISDSFLSEQTTTLAKQFKGLALEAIKANVKEIAANKITVCLNLDKGETEKAVKAAKEVNKHVNEATKIRFGLFTALNEAIKENSKTTLPELTCYIKQFYEKTIAVYPETDGAKELVKSFLDAITVPTITTLEEKKGKASDNCELKEATSNPTEFKSFTMAIIKAISNLDK